MTLKLVDQMLYGPKSGTSSAVYLFVLHKPELRNEALLYPATIFKHSGDGDLESSSRAHPQDSFTASFL